MWRRKSRRVVWDGWQGAVGLILVADAEEGRKWTHQISELVGLKDGAGGQFGKASRDGSRSSKRRVDAEAVKTEIEDVMLS
jgi:hypothetical protein